MLSQKSEAMQAQNPELPILSFFVKSKIKKESLGWE